MWGKRNRRRCYWCCDVIFLLWRKWKLETGRACSSSSSSGLGSRGCPSQRLFSWCNLFLLLLLQHRAASAPLPTHLLLQRSPPQTVLSHRHPGHPSGGMWWHTARSRQERVPSSLRGAPTHTHMHGAQTNPALVNEELFRWGKSPVCLQRHLQIPWSASDFQQCLRVALSQKSKALP